MSRHKTVAEGWVPLTHGTPSSYNRGCRCDTCKAANTRRLNAGGWKDANRRARFAERVPDEAGRLVHPNPYGGHGSLTAYTSCGCRCEPCREAHRAYRQSRKGDAS